MTPRSYPRFPVTVPLFVTFGGKVYQKQVRLQSKDVSGGGLAFETSQRIPIDSDTKVLVSGLGDLVPEARIEGRVVYRRRDPATRRYAVGIAFAKFVNVDREELLRHIARWENERQLTPT